MLNICIAVITVSESTCDGTALLMIVCYSVASAAPGSAVHLLILWGPAPSNVWPSNQRGPRPLFYLHGLLLVFIVMFGRWTIQFVWTSLLMWVFHLRTC